MSRTLSLVLVLLGSGWGCEFNRDSRRCEPRIPEGGLCVDLRGGGETDAPRLEIAVPEPPGTSFTDHGCVAGAICDTFGSGSCMMLPDLGQPCLHGMSCVAPLVCDFETGRCAEGGRDGQGCTGRPCAAGHRCHEGTCLLSERFSPCTQSAECPAGHFCERSGTRSCLPRRALGEACETSDTCPADAVCSVDGVCVGALTHGDLCRDACGEELFCTN